MQKLPPLTTHPHDNDPADCRLCGRWVFNPLSMQELGIPTSIPLSTTEDLHAAVSGLAPGSTGSAGRAAAAPQGRAPPHPVGEALHGGAPRARADGVARAGRVRGLRRQRQHHSAHLRACAAGPAVGAARLKHSGLGRARWGRAAPVLSLAGSALWRMLRTAQRTADWHLGGTTA